MINNSVTDRNGKVIGFVCSRCNKVYQSMWGTVCNKCRDEDEKHNELIKEIQELKEKLRIKESEAQNERN